ncbi:MAG: chromate transporter [Thermotogae bacterium]|nr:chromate transporter [Thermotogota bacterium]
MHEMIRMVLIFFKAGILAFGGGWTTINFLKRELVDIHHCLSYGEFLDILSVSQATPGPIAVNLATYVGNRMGGIITALACTFAVVASPMLFMMIFLKLVKKLSPSHIAMLDDSLHLGVVLLVSGALFSLLPAVLPDWRLMLISIVTFTILLKTGISPPLLILLMGIGGIFFCC